MLTSNDKISRIKNLLSYFPSKPKKQIQNDIPNLSSEENKAISNLLNDKSIIIFKADKGNVIVILNKQNYINKENELLNGKNVFKKISSNLTEKREQLLINFLLKLKRNKIINEKEYKERRPMMCSRMPENSYNYNTAKYLANLLTFATTCNKSYIKDSFDFVEKIKQHRITPRLMCSFDVWSLFTNIPLNKAIEIGIKNIRKYNKKLKFNNEELSCNLEENIHKDAEQRKREHQNAFKGTGTSKIAEH
ncbi:unnamed protein product, partial [Rotaria sordida]